MTLARRCPGSRCGGPAGAGQPARRGGGGPREHRRKEAGGRALRPGQATGRQGQAAAATGREPEPSRARRAEQLGECASLGGLEEAAGSAPVSGTGIAPEEGRAFSRQARSGVGWRPGDSQRRGSPGGLRRRKDGEVGDAGRVRSCGAWGFPGGKRALQMDSSGRPQWGLLGLGSPQVWQRQTE